MIQIDVAPPGLGMSDEVHAGELFENLVKALEVQIVGSVLEVEKDRDVELLRDGGDELAVF